MMFCDCRLPENWNGPYLMVASARVVPSAANTRKLQTTTERTRVPAMSRSFLALCGGAALGSPAQGCQAVWGYFLPPAPPSSKQGRPGGASPSRSKFNHDQWGFTDASTACPGLRRFADRRLRGGGGGSRRAADQV